MEEIDRTASMYDCPIEHIKESQDIGMTLLLEEQRLRLEVSGSHAPPSFEGDKSEPRAGLPAAACKDGAAQTRAATLVSVAVGGSPTGTADVGVQASRGPGDPPARRKNRRRKKSGAQYSAPASPSSDSAVNGIGGGDMTAAGPPKDGGREQGNKRDEGAKAPPRSPVSGLSFAAVAASAGESRPPPLGAVTVGGARGGGIGKVRAPVDGGALRVSPSSSPPPPRPEPKRKKGGPPPLKAAACREKPPSPVQAATSGAGKVTGMRTLGSSIPAKDPWVGGRDVTADKFLSAVSLLAEWGRGGGLGLPGPRCRGLAPVRLVPRRTWVDGRGAGRPRHKT